MTILQPPEGGARIHGLEMNDHDSFVELDDVEGMVTKDGRSINDAGPFKIKHVYKSYKKKDGKEGKRFNGYQFEISNLSEYSASRRRGDSRRCPSAEI